MQPRGAPESLAIALCGHRVPRITAGSLLAAAETAWAAAFHVQFHPEATAPQIPQSGHEVHLNSLSQTAPLTNRASASEETAFGAGGRGVVFQNTMVFSSHGF